MEKLHFDKKETKQEIILIEVYFFSNLAQFALIFFYRKNKQLDFRATYWNKEAHTYVEGPGLLKS